MRTVLLVFAVLGFVAVLRRVALAAFGLLGRGVERLVAGETAEVRARRGDLTGLSEADAQHVGARRAQLTALAIFSFWLLLLVAPALTPWPLVLYACYSVLWLIPRTPVRRT